jgi:iron complex transport system substrate-binding protein
VRALLALLTCAVALSACGGSGGSAGGDDGAAAGGTHEVQHKYGTTTVEGTPERVVVVGLREVDALLAMDVVPVAITRWFPDVTIQPWAQDELGDRPEPEVLTNDDGIQIERIAALRPDLIVATYSDLTKEDFDRLSELAPVVAQPEGVPDYGSSWQQDTLMVGAALGKDDEAQRLVDDTEAKIAKAKADHPEFEGQTATFVMDYQGSFVYGKSDVRTRFLEDLGFTYPDALADRFKTDFGGQLSDERLDLLDLGVVAWITQEENGPAKIKQRPVYRDLQVRKAGRDLFMQHDDPGFYAVPSQTVLSIPTLLSDVVPRIAAAADGDPATSTDPQ